MRLVSFNVADAAVDEPVLLLAEAATAAGDLRS